MAAIVNTLREGSQFRISPSWCHAQHTEPYALAHAFAKDVIDRRGIIELIDLDEGALDSQGLPPLMGEPTYHFPVVFRSRDGDYRCLNDVSSLIADRSLHPQQRIACIAFDEGKINSDRFKLIDFRFGVLDSALMPRSRKDRSYRGDKLIRRLNDDHDLCRLIEVYWLGREPVGLSAAEKSGLTNGQISKTKFTPSFRRARTAKTGSDKEEHEIQGNNWEAW